MFVFRLRNNQDLQTFLDEVSALIDKSTLLEMYRLATKEEYSFFYIFRTVLYRYSVLCCSYILYSSVNVFCTLSTARFLHFGQFCSCKCTSVQCCSCNLYSAVYVFCTVLFMYSVQCCSCILYSAVYVFCTVLFMYSVRTVLYINSVHNCRKILMRCHTIEFYIESYLKRNWHPSR